MSEWLPLADRTFVVNLPDAGHQFIAEGNLAQNNSLLLGLFGFVPALEPERIVPPIVERRNGESSEVVPLERIQIPWLGLWQFLHECEQIWWPGRHSQRIQHRFWVFQKAIFVTVDAGDPDQPPLCHDAPAVNVHIPYSG